MAKIGIRVTSPFLQLIIHALIIADAVTQNKELLVHRSITRYTLLQHQAGGRERTQKFIDWLINKLHAEDDRAG